MVYLDITSSPQGKPRVPADKITAATLTKASGTLTITYTGDSGESKTFTFAGQDAVDYYNALVALAAGTYSAV